MLKDTGLTLRPRFIMCLLVTMEAITCMLNPSIEEGQQGIRKRRRTMDMLFALRAMHETATTRCLSGENTHRDASNAE